MLKRFGHVLLIVAVLSATGTHWLLLQSVAWSTMLANNLSTTSLSEAVEKTFDGKHPCCLCKQITKGKQEEKKSQLMVDLRKLEFSFARVVFDFTPPARFELMPVETFSATGISLKPPLPPPRAAVV